jgi:hypothetical protein
MRPLFVLLLLTGLARADDVSTALGELDRGVALFQSGDLTAARAAFARARDLVPDKANPYRWLGLVDARLGRCAEAIQELDEFVRRVPTNDTRAVEAITIRDRCKEELQPKVGTLVIESTPPGAEVHLDEPEAPAGVTPYRNDAVPVGSHVVYLHKPGYRALEKSVRVGRNETVRLDLALSAEPTPSPSPSPSPSVVLTPPSTQPPAPTVEKRKSKLWIIGVVAGAVAVAGLGVGLGIGLSGHSNETVLPPLKSQ